MSREARRPGTLAGIREIAAAALISPQAAVKASNRPGFPRPIDEIAAGPVWRRADVDRWLETRENTQRRGGTP